RTRAEAHRLLARGGAARLYLRQGAVRSDRGRRFRRDLHHLGGDAGRGGGAGRRVPAVRRCRRRCRAEARRRKEVRALLEDFARGRVRSAIPRGDAARRAGVARVGSDAPGGGVGRLFASKWYGPLTRLGVVAVVLTVVADQATKWWVLSVLDLPSRGRVAAGPFIDLVLA